MPYLAMTAAEFRCCYPLPEKIAWMACHFSPYGTGLTNLPRELPPGAILILNDRTPVQGHDPVLIRELLGELVKKFQCAGLLLDFQRTDCGETQRITESLLDLPCPVCATKDYALGLDCPVFLPPVPLLQPLEEYLSPWQGREIWLEAALDGVTITLTDQGSAIAPLSPGESPTYPHFDGELLCHYRMEVASDRATFTLRRTMDDLTALLDRAKKQGVTTAVGLWQELGKS